MTQTKGRATSYLRAINVARSVEAIVNNCNVKLCYIKVKSLARFRKIGTHVNILSPVNSNASRKYIVMKLALQFSVFTSHVIKTKHRNHSIKKVKNLGDDRLLLYEHPREASGLCCLSFASYSQKCATQIYRALSENPPSEGHKYGGRKVTKNICH